MAVLKHLSLASEKNNREINALSATWLCISQHDCVEAIAVFMAWSNSSGEVRCLTKHA
jgi:hypothetical protein